ncbi:MKRN2 opposite strand protein [Microplitis mediator]|uniref:MKRN2 opposite strand protein n=1 Tax=Microplitis mediator TaxID=375433 RepID=UPI00255669EA|nr:MKRN2 opposite strand protein [Microplitis mediator]
MSYDILCFKHCNSKSIFCKTIPEKCPICNIKLINLSIEPFVLPYCCTKAANNPTSIVLKPSYGTFCNDYNITNDMHIGLVDSQCQLYEYDHRGITHNNFDDWSDCIVINDLIPESWYCHWDEVLSQLIINPIWSSSNYNPTSFNCYNFIIEFLKLLNYNNLKFIDKEHVFNEFFLPKLRYTLKYIYIYRKLKNNCCYIA